MCKTRRLVVPLALLVGTACGGDPPVAVDDADDSPPTGNDPPTATEGFADPVDAPLNDVQFYGGYVDLLSGSGRQDYECRQKTYDGHQGTDILLRNFVVMDSGVTVVAAAVGRVVEVRDGVFDRSVENGSGGFGNFVALDHGGNVRTIYGHLRRNSLRVSMDDRVAEGQALGLIGSSGNSNWPHLHFEVQVGGTPVDPFEGACGTSGSRWETQLEYQDTVMVTDADISDLGYFGLGELLERPEVVDTFTTAHASLSLWVQVLNLPQTAVRVDLYAPDEKLHDTWSNTFGGTFSMWYVMLHVNIAGVLSDEGEWRLDYYHGSELMLSRSFTLVPAPAAAAPVRRPERPVGVLTGFGVVVEQREP